MYEKKIVDSEIAVGRVSVRENDRSRVKPKCKHRNCSDDGERRRLNKHLRHYTDPAANQIFSLLAFRTCLCYWWLFATYHNGLMIIMASLDLLLFVNCNSSFVKQRLDVRHKRLHITSIQIESVQQFFGSDQTFYNSQTLASN